MDNIILTGMLKDFATRHGFDDDSGDVQFEKFANYCLWKADHYDSFDFDKVGTGKCMGIDGIAIAISGVIIDNLEDAQALTKASFEVRFLFAQTKTSASFDSGEFMKFAGTVKLFFGTDASAIPTELKNAFKIKTLIYERASKMKELPTVELEYVYSGKYSSDKNKALPVINDQVGSIRAMPYLFKHVKWDIHDGDAIARLYREAQNEVQKDISFQRHVALPSIRGARAAYIGVVKCADYVSLIQKENGDLNKGLFFENVRDFLGTENAVNEDIAKTINTEEERNRFAILNNGVTLVAKSVTPSGDIFKISQFQVVNGCQTSHVLYNNRANLSDDMFLTVKLIETSDVDLGGKVIATTNSQSLVTKEAFATIRPYHRGLEDFFNAMRSSGYGYYYERRPHQYDGMDNIRQSYIVSAPLLIKSFISVVLEEPHKVHYYYGRLLQEYNKDRSSELFAEADYPGMYFAAHHISAKVKTKAGKDKRIVNWIYHIALLVKKDLAPELKRGSPIPDKMFLNVLSTIDAGFNNAYNRARDTILNAKLTSNDNRVPEITKKLISSFAGRSGPPRAKKTESSPPALNHTLTNGNYVGIVTAIDQNSLIIISYGPYTIHAPLPSESPAPKLGQRISFSVSEGVATWNSEH
ncbi:AIPR family protein [Xanthomonas campestris pv. cannae]|nr:AIPR family protein [Xanthomonas campestris pv. cannae]